MLLVSIAFVACTSEVTLGSGNPAPGGQGQAPNADGTCATGLVVCAGRCQPMCGSAPPVPDPDPVRDGGADAPVPGPLATPQVLASGLSMANGIAVRGDFVYVTETGAPIEPPGGRVLKIPRLGGALTVLASAQDAPQAIAVNATDVFWTNAGHVASSTQVYKFGEVKKVAVAGGTPTTLATGEVWSFQLALDANHVYWVDNGWPTGGSSDPNPAARGVFRVDQDGSNRTRLAAIGGVAGHHVGLTADDVVWTATGTIYRQSKIATPAPLNSFWKSSDAAIPWDLAIDNGVVYWTNLNTQEVLRAPLAGGPASVLASGLGNLGGIAVDGTHVYFTTCPPAQSSPCSVHRVPASGGTPDTLATGFKRTSFITTDADSVYFTTQESVVRIKK